MDNERKNEMKKKSIKLTLKIIIKKILGIPHSLTGIYIKLSMKIVKFFKNKKNKELPESEESSRK